MVRPDVSWYGEQLAPGTLGRIDYWLNSCEEIDLVLVIGPRALTSSTFISEARNKNARVAHFDLHWHDDLVEEDDWFVQGDIEMSLAIIVQAALETQSLVVH